jgi:hypothetical protein
VKSPHAISRLLAGRNRLSRPEKEQILERVLAEVAPRRRRRWWLVAAPAVAAAALLVLVLGPWRGREQPDFGTRGAGSARGVFEPSCARDCIAGDKILFDLHGTTGYRYFAAFSRRADGTVLWYFPTSDDAVGIDLSQHLGSGVLDRGIVIGGEHAPGTYRVFGVFSHEPLSRAQIRERFEPTSLVAGPGTSVIERELVVR